MYPGTHATASPDKVAHVMADSAEQVTYRELDERSNQLAQLMRAAGLRPGDHIAALLENNVRYPEVYWAAIRSGLYVTTVNRYLTAEEAAYIVEDCGAKVLVSSAAMGEVAVHVARQVADCPVRLMVDGVAEDFEPYEDALAAQPAEPLADEPMGETMLYSSGTTGRPKGIKRPLSGRHASEGAGISSLLGPLFQMDADTVYLSPAPMYHSAPLGFSMGVQVLGGTVVIMERFDPEAALAAIEAHRVTHSQWVPTMFSRMLKLPEEARTRHDLSSHRVAIHAAAPCPVGVKEQMIRWWGPILFEYYGGTEVNGLTYITAEEWLAHRGSVGKPVLGTIHICDESGAELPTGEPGLVYFELPKRPFEYHGDPEKTRKAEHPEHSNWTALGDVGYVDDEGYLYLTDRATFMIISGGVNIYPQEIEDVLILHPGVADVAVIGVPNEEFGEEVKAVVQVADPSAAGPELAERLLAYAREHLAAYKVPRSIDFEDELPRLPTGKLYKRLLRDRYWGKTGSRIV